MLLIIPPNDDVINEAMRLSNKLNIHSNLVINNNANLGVCKGNNQGIQESWKMTVTMYYYWIMILNLVKILLKIY